MSILVSSRLVPYEYIVSILRARHILLWRLSVRCLIGPRWPALAPSFLGNNYNSIEIRDRPSKNHRLAGHSFSAARYTVQDAAASWIYWSTWHLLNNELVKPVIKSNAVADNFCDALSSTFLSSKMYFGIYEYECTDCLFLTFLLIERAQRTIVQWTG